MALGDMQVPAVPTCPVHSRLHHQQRRLLVEVTDVGVDPGDIILDAGDAILLTVDTYVLADLLSSGVPEDLFAGPASGMLRGKAIVRRIRCADAAPFTFAALHPVVDGYRTEPVSQLRVGQDQPPVKHCDQTVWHILVSLVKPGRDVFVETEVRGQLDTAHG